MMVLEEFFDNYFKLIKEVNDFHFEYLVSNKFKFPKTNYLELKKFIDTATNFLSDIDEHILNDLAGKLYNDINSLYKFYKDIKNKTKYVELVFYQEYLEKKEEYRTLKEEYEQLKKSMEEYNSAIAKFEEQLKTLKKDTPEYKKVKRNYVDTIYELSKNKDRFYQVKEELERLEKEEERKFFPKFEKLKDLHIKKLEKILNVKLYYFEKLLWHNASNSQAVVKFFETSNIDGDFSTKTFIKYFLKKIDPSKTQDSEWYSYLQKMLKVAE
jgi:DNA repair exonuclease SbcCD ATPase subunit